MSAAKGLDGLEERWADVRGVTVRYYAGGRGPSVVLLHGLGGAAVNWRPVAAELSQRCRLLVPDLPGHGGSAAVPALPDLTPFADIVHDLCRREGMTPATLAGHSLGAVVAIRHAVRHAEHTSGLVLAAAAGISSSGRMAEVLLGLSTFLQPGRRLARHKRRIAANARLRALVFGGWGASDPLALSPEAAEALLEDVRLHTAVGEAARALVRDDVRPLFQHVACPCLVLWGARDTQVPVRDAFEYARGLGADLRLIADCGHLLIVERPEVLADAIGTIAEARSSA